MLAVAADKPAAVAAFGVQLEVAAEVVALHQAQVDRQALAVQGQSRGLELSCDHHHHSC